MYYILWQPPNAKALAGNVFPVAGTYFTELFTYAIN